MKKLFLSAILLIGVSVIVNAMKVTVCVGVGVVSVCTDFEITCNKTPKGGVSCTVDPARVISLDGKINYRTGKLVFRIPNYGGWDNVQKITLEKDVYMKDAKGKNSSIKLKAGVYSVRNGVVELTFQEIKQRSLKG